jgi:acid stress chaperone HdeB
MFRVAVVGVVLLAAAGSTPAPAQVVLDVSKLTCEQYATYKVTNPKFIAIWISGFQHGKRGDTLVDTQKLDTDMDKVTEFCIDNPQTPVMEAVEKVIGGAG